MIRAGGSKLDRHICSTGQGIERAADVVAVILLHPDHPHRAGHVSCVSCSSLPAEWRNEYFNMHDRPAFAVQKSITVTKSYPGL